MRPNGTATISAPTAISKKNKNRPPAIVHIKLTLSLVLMGAEDVSHWDLHG
jgi:hypothetical protein